MLNRLCRGESPLLLVAASGDVATANALLAAPSIQVDLLCALGVTAFHVAANAGDVKVCTFALLEPSLL